MTETIFATATSPKPGRLTAIVAEFSRRIESAATGKAVTAADFAPVAELVAVDTFKRVGAYLEVLDWDAYVRFLTAWAGGTRFETTVFRISEIGRAVFYEIEERHYKGDAFIRKNVIAVYAFDDNDKIRHLDIYEQAKDSGRWIAEAAEAAMAQ